MRLKSAKAKFATGSITSGSLWRSLTELVGTSIVSICPNGFHDPDASHCAHFVSHVLQFDFGCTCGELTGGSGPSACVRVHEIFCRCSRVGNWAERPPQSDVLAFVSRPTAFDLASKTLMNIPNKHVGIFCNERVFHYSSRQNSVVMKTVDGFRAYLDDIYGPGQRMVYGTINGLSATRPKPSTITPR